MTYQIAPIPDNEAERLAALRSAMCAFVPREERFDRITRMAQRLLQVPIVLISVIEEDAQWFRSAQGMTVLETPRDASFCSHAMLKGEVLQIRDTLLDPRWSDNPMVIGPPFIRSYCGWPLELAPGLRIGALCVIDTMPRTYSAEDLDMLSDLAHMAESELRVNAMADNQKAVLVESSRAQRRQLLDPSTGCWSESGFHELMARALRDVATGKAHAVLCGIRIHNIEEFEVGDEGECGAKEVRAMLVSQFIRQRLPASAVLCHLEGARACALFAASDKSQLREQLDIFLQEPGSQPVAGIAFSHQLEITSSPLRLKAEHVDVEPSRLLDQVMSRLDKNAGSTLILR
jgi:GAF domain-containing protein